jgi:ribosomal protein S7
MMKITPTVLLVPLKLSGTVHGVPVAISERKQYTFAVNEL